ncbi:MAG: hypothetical protein DMG41_23950 [Acidobacteria bacterium]|nr:MAG: hypothetical protein AUH01_06325 [Acidobacteria bacterium 13_2_20CM_56_17]PYT85366.1 MAG: hypothetical protein DMG41_23950 [Acidobacteriota bacterium]
MFTDAPPRKSNVGSFLDSDRRNATPLPSGARLLTSADSIEAAMKDGTTRDVQRACMGFLRIASNFYRVPECSVRCRPTAQSAGALDCRAFWRLRPGYAGDPCLETDRDTQRDHLLRHLP